MTRWLLIIVFSIVSGSVSASPIQYQFNLSFQDQATNQMDRLNHGLIYERVTRGASADIGEFWGGCDEALPPGTSAPCGSNTSDYTTKFFSSFLSSWELLDVNINNNFAIDGEVFGAETRTDSSDGSSLSGSFTMHLTDDLIRDAMLGEGEGIRLVTNFSWLGFGALDMFEGVTGQWSTELIADNFETPDGFFLESSLLTKIKASSVDTGLGLVEGPNVIIDQVIEGNGEGSGLFSPDLSFYGFEDGEVINFSASFEQRLSLSKTIHAVPEPGTTFILSLGILGIIALRLRRGLSAKALDAFVPDSR